jgi:anti-anti-sigma factor
VSERLARVSLSRPDERTIVATVRGEVDASNADELDEVLDAAAREARRLVVDLTSVDYLDSHGVRVLQHLADRHHAGGIELTLVARRESLAGDLLAITNLAAGVPVEEPSEQS